MSEEQLFQKAQEVVSLIEPLGEIEQQAVLELADTLRGYKRVTHRT